MRRAILKLGAGLVLCAAAWAACGGETISHKVIACEFTLPAGWKKAGDIGGSLSLNADVSASFLVIAKNVNEGSGLRSCFEIDRVKSLMQRCELADAKLSKVAGRVAIKMELEEAQSTNRWALYYIVVGTRGYIIRCWAEKSDFGKYVKDFDAIVASFKIIDSK